MLVPTMSALTRGCRRARRTTSPAIRAGAAATRLVVLSGCSGGGKSALVAEMTARGFRAFPEPGGRWSGRSSWSAGDALPWVDGRRFAERCIARAAYFFNVADPSGGPLFFDRSIIDAVAALERMGAAPEPCAEAARRYRYGRRVFLVPPGRRCSPPMPSGGMASRRRSPSMRRCAGPIRRTAYEVVGGAARRGCGPGGFPGGGGLPGSEP